MKSILALFLMVFIISCNASDNSSNTGRTEDSLKLKDKNDVKGPGLENSGGTTSTGTFTDSTNMISRDSSHHKQ